MTDDSSYLDQRRAPLVAEMEGDGWTPCGRWLTFHYFKRPEPPLEAALA